ncbi:MAG TPA: molybdopterin-dependent oxidoreductase [Roseiarcus sp.]|nr:molybdopterin-dependent oxidoreductase [Roseiarcus sp.]
MLTRRRAMIGAAGSLAFGAGRAFSNEMKPPPLASGLPAGVREIAELDALPGKVPLIKLTYRPPNYETPIAYFHDSITPNDAFFVRYHLADIPKAIDADAWRLEIAGDGAEKPFALSLAELKAFPAVETIAVLQCSGARRGLFAPHVPGVQWGYGAMGAARWKGARLKDILAKAALKAETIEIVLDGADGPVLDKTPKFVKSLPIWKALDETVLVAYEMNGAPLPHWNGFPARVVVPGWTGTYWMKHLTSLRAATKPFSGYWMASAYRIPAGKFAFVQHFRSQETDASTPITEMMVNTLVTEPSDGARLPVGRPVNVRGLAWDAGYAIEAVEVSTDSGKSFSEASLGDDSGRFAFRAFSYSFTPTSPGRIGLVVKARNRIGQTQTDALIANPGGYHHNLMPRLFLEIVG